MFIRTIFFVATALACTESYKILGIFPMPGISHYILASKLMKGLSEAGHDITMVSPYALKDLPKNGTFTDVVLDGLAEDFQTNLKNTNPFDADDSTGPIEKFTTILNFFDKMVNDTMHHPKMKQLAASNQKFDAVVMEQFFNEAHKVYGQIFDCPLILLSSVGPNSMVNPTVGNPQPVSYVGNALGGDFSKNISFYNRAKNLLLYIIQYVFTKVVLHPRHDRIIHDIYPNSPALSELYNNVSLVLVNSHISLNRAVPLVPNMVEIGGYFIDAPQKLPKDLQEYMDNATDGVIYFSMGSTLNSKDLPEAKKLAILRVLGKLKQKIIWKFEEDLPGKPSNVMIRKWCPQQDILVALKEVNLFDHGTLGPIDKSKIPMQVGIQMANGTLRHPNMVRLTASNQKFDAVIMEQFVNDALKVYGYIFDCPVILLSSMGTTYWINNVVGNPEPVSYAPQLYGNDITKDLSFGNRARNLLLYIVEYFMTNFVVLPVQDEIIRSLYPEAPSMADLYHNVSLVLLNSHTSLYPALPLVPNMIEIGGYFIDPPKKLPEDLQEYLDNAPDGVIYFSMGSNLRSNDITPKKKQAILNVLGKLKQKVIWKFEENLRGKPSNVMIRSWCPQPDILAHPNVKLFISHGGLLSITETIYHGVPILAIPVFGDQPGNAERAVVNGYGLRMDYIDPNFNEEKLGYLINELLTNPTYRDTVKEKSRQYHDRPMKPMETAVYWVEYVIRHKGAPHLMVAGVKLPWYKYFLVDVVSAFVASFLLVLYILKRIIEIVICKTNNISRRKKEKKN